MTPTFPRSGVSGHAGAVQSDLTTIKVTKTLRDRISAAADQQHQTVQRFIENVLEELEQHRRLAAVGEAMGNADEHTLDDWRAETDALEAAETSGRSASPTMAGWPTN